MLIELPSRNLSFTVSFTIKNETNHDIKMGILAVDPDMSNLSKNIVTTYHHRETVLHSGSSRNFELSFPISPSKIDLFVYNTAVGDLAYGQDNSFSVTPPKISKVRVYDAWWDSDMKTFYQLACDFAKTASFLVSSKPINKNGKINNRVASYKDDGGRFIICYYDFLVNSDGKKSNSPARIGNVTGIIDVSKEAFLKMSVPERLIVLLHEFSHKYMNPKVGLKVNHESGADIQALYVYLGKGWSPYEAQKAFLKVFEKANNQENAKRFGLIKSFIKKYESGQVADLKK